MTDSNLDPAEIAKFEALANRWWDRSGEFKPLHDINPLRCNFIDLHSPVAEQKVLDVGCGGGILSEALAQRGASVTGIDMGESPLQVAQLHSLESGVKVDYRQITAEALAEQEAGTYDIVTCMEMLEHVPQPQSVVAACSKLCKPGGHVYFSTINRNPKAYALMVVGAEYLLKMLPRGTHDYAKFIRPSELATWMRSSDLQLEHLTGVVYNPLNKQFRLDDRDVDVNYMVHSQRDQ